MARKPLGRGLSALLGEAVENEANFETETRGPTGVADVDVSLIFSNPEQPRTRFDEKSLVELAASIRANGIVQPIVVRSVGSRYQIVAGERRWRAAQQVGLARVPVVVKEVDDEKLLEIALIENIQREELNPIEEAVAYRKLIENIGLTQEQVAERVGKERSLIATAIRLLKLPAKIQDLVADGKLSAGHGRALLLTDDETLQFRTARAIVEKQISVRETERVVKRGNSEPRAIEQATKTQTTDPNLRFAETKMMRALGTNVRIKPGGTDGAGKIEIEYYNNDDLDRIFRHLTGGFPSVDS